MLEIHKLEKKDAKNTARAKQDNLEKQKKNSKKVNCQEKSATDKKNLFLKTSSIMSASFKHNKSLMKFKHGERNTQFSVITNIIEESEDDKSIDGLSEKKSPISTKIGKNSIYSNKESKLKEKKEGSQSHHQSPEKESNKEDSMSPKKNPGNFFSLMKNFKRQSNKSDTTKNDLKKKAKNILEKKPSAAKLYKFIFMILLIYRIYFQIL